MMRGWESPTGVGKTHSGRISRPPPHQFVATRTISASVSAAIVREGSSDAAIRSPTSRHWLYVESPLRVPDQVRPQGVMASTLASAVLRAFSATSGPNAMPSTTMTSTSVMPMNPRAVFK
jgi:hypothetical protein